MYFLLIILAIIAHPMTAETLLNLQLDINSQLIRITETDNSSLQDTLTYTMGVLKHRPFNCPIKMDGTYLIAVTFWSNVFHQESFTAFRCRRITKIWTRKHHINKPIELNVEHSFQTLTDAACNYMARYKYAPIEATPEPMIQVNSTFFKTQRDLIINNTLLYATANWTFETINFELEVINITLNSVTGHIQSNTFPEINGCFFSKHSCRTANELVIWNLNNANHCELTRHDADNCYLNLHHLICP